MREAIESRKLNAKIMELFAPLRAYRVAQILPWATIEMAAGMMWSFDVDYLAVVQDSKPVGILSADQVDPIDLAGPAPALVAEMMTREPVVISERTTAFAALETMKRCGTDCLLVCSPRREIRGVICRDYCSAGLPLEKPVKDLFGKKSGQGWWFALGAWISRLAHVEPHATVEAFPSEEELRWHGKPQTGASN